MGLADMIRMARGDEPADLVLRNGAIYTVDASRRWADAVAIRDGRIVTVAPAASARAISMSQSSTCKCSAKPASPVGARMPASGYSSESITTMPGASSSSAWPIGDGPGPPLQASLRKQCPKTSSAKKSTCTPDAPVTFL